jgi:hypothetical protein
MLTYADVCIQLVLTYADECIQLVRALAACLLTYADVCIQLVLTYADVCIQLVRALAACLECPLAWVQVEDVHAGGLYTYICRSCLEYPLAIYTYIYIYM